MSRFYTGRKTKNLFDPSSKTPFRISRSKLELFCNCPRCFYLEKRLGVAQPPGFPFALNSAVDKLLKKEFDSYRNSHTPHPLMQQQGIKAIPFKHDKLDYWRDALRGGMEYLHAPTNILLSGAIDDLWSGPEGELFVVDYKSTAKEEPVNLDADWQSGYKRQMEIYQWLFRKNGFNVSSTGYFVYCNGLTSKEVFDARLDFSIKIIPYSGSDAWIEPKIFDMHKCLMSPVMPGPGIDCDYCLYQKALKEVEK